ncbi:hypothetical protein F4803DRAFT_526986 [Xylaria telfairii]|nr:hypothetical protein F4803DRAFT_526986 [Xylaria telfairii]
MASRYVSVHETPNGPGDTRPTAIQIIKDEGLEGKLVGQTILITGCSAGIGIETSRALYLTGATLYLTARNLEKAKTALSDIVSSDRVHLLELDLASLASVRACAAEYLSKNSSLNILICNAGVLMPPEGRTKDGFEIHFGTNHLSHFLLFNLLRPALLAGATPEKSSRAVILSSLGHRFGGVNFDNVNFEGTYEPMAAYSQSKTANLWTANEIERRYSSQGLHAWSIQPGSVITDIWRHIPREQEAGFWADPQMAKIVKNPEQGAATSVWAAIAAALEGQGGRYLENCQIIGPYDASTGSYGPGFAPHAYDVENAQKLWEKSLEWVGL